MDFLKKTNRKYTLAVVGSLLVLGSIYYLATKKTKESPRHPESHHQEPKREVKEEKKDAAPS
jgi:hypothetical protein